MANPVDVRTGEITSALEDESEIEIEVEELLVEEVSIDGMCGVY